MKLAWATDIHLNFVSEEETARFCETVARTGADRLLITGDIAESLDLGPFLGFMADRLGRPIDFVLGNHDFYGGRISEVRAAMAETTRTIPTLNWLPESGVINLGSGVALIGHDGWGDGRLGNFAGSTIRLNDYRLIGELAGLDQARLGQTLGLLGDEAAAHIRRTLPKALKQYEMILVATHVPPFREACVFKGRIANDEWIPHFSCAAVGKVLAEIMADHPDQRVLVLCGHVHSSGMATIRPNLVVLTGSAEYRRPDVFRVFNVPDDLNFVFREAGDPPSG
ncbi:metallophosphoesterase family protein [Tautonia rosea]|uniref:metallophosphoesterase family protein n=1 Tax=Tautonia rosea TaxID=2728037 RepID=UPI0014737C4A|nr:metallophosphoesterase [Tautonia rosea]